METVDFDLPTFWASPLINSDTSGLEDDDNAALEAFTDYMVEAYGQCWAINCGDDKGNFMTYHDARQFGVLACDVLTYTFDITPNKEG